MVRVAIGKWVWRVFVAYRLKGVMQDMQDDRRSGRVSVVMSEDLLGSREPCN